MGTSAVEAARARARRRWHEHVARALPYRLLEVVIRERGMPTVREIRDHLLDHLQVHEVFLPMQVNTLRSQKANS